MDTKNHLSARFRELIQETGLQQKDLAVKMGVSAKTVSALKSGQQAWSAEMVARAAGAFGISVTAFWNEQEEESAPPTVGDALLVFTTRIPPHLADEWKDLLAEEVRTPKNMVIKLVSDALRDRRR